MAFIKNAGDNKEQQKLDEHLKTRSYISGGSEPDHSDAETYNLFVTAKIHPTKPPHLARWFKHIASFSDAERKQQVTFEYLFVSIDIDVSIYLISSRWPSASSSSGSTSKEPTPANDDEFDLFGSDEDEESEEAKRIREERLAAYAAKKAKKPGPIAKSSIVFDVKPWDDETNLDGRNLY